MALERYLVAFSGWLSWTSILASRAIGLITFQDFMPTIFK